MKVPVFTNAIGGILVGLVTTAAGGVRKVNIRIHFQAKFAAQFLLLIYEIDNSKNNKVK